MNRRVLAILAAGALAVVLAAAAGLLLAPEPAAAAPGAAVAAGLPFPVPPVIPPPLPNPLSTAGSVSGGIEQAAASTVLDAVSKWVSGGAASLLGALASAIDNRTNPADTEPWLDGHFGTMALIAADLAIPLLVAVAITAIVRRDLGLLLRAAFVQAPLALLGTTVAMAMVAIALGATDELCTKVAGATDPNTAGLLRNLVVALSKGGPDVTGFGLVLVSVLIAMGGFFLTVELVVREAAIWVAMLFLPLGLVAFIWPATARWGRRLAELLAVLVLSKFVIVAIVSMAVSATSSGLSQPDIGPLFGGAALLLLAAAAPFTLLRMVPIVEAGVVAHLEGVGRRAVAPPQVVQQMAQQSAHEQISRMLEQRTSDARAPSTAPGPVGGEPAPTALPTRGRDPDGTQAGDDKPEAASGWRNGVRVVGPGPAGGGTGPAGGGPGPAGGGPGPGPAGPGAGPGGGGGLGGGAGGAGAGGAGAAAGAVIA